MSLLSKAEIQKGISDLDGWEYVDGSINTFIDISVSC